MKVTYEDRESFLDPRNKTACIWALWHNRLLMSPFVRIQVIRHRLATVLTSASKDGEILASVVRKFGMASIRGSSAKRGTANKRGSQAMRELMQVLKDGGDVCFTPDGPRGPRYQIGSPGIVVLASHSGAPIVPVGIDFDRCWKLKSWDQFRIPKPFTTCRVRMMPQVHVPRPSDTFDLEAQIVRVREALMGSIETE